MPERDPVAHAERKVWEFAMCMLFLREVPMRETFEMTEDAEGTEGSEGAAPAVS